jgi:hypothetical protein
MKPGDHPDFYRFPAPPGRSRESRIVLDEQGQFWNDGVRMEHPGLVRAFASWVRRHPDDGRYILSNGYDWTYFEVRDAPFFVRAIDFRDGAPWVRLADGSEEPLRPDGVLVGAGDALYVLVRDGEFEAKLLPSAQSAMVDVLEENEAGDIGVTADGKWYPVRHRGADSADLARADPGDGAPAPE